MDAENRVSEDEQAAAEVAKFRAVQAAERAAEQAAANGAGDEDIRLQIQAFAASLGVEIRAVPHFQVNEQGFAIPPITASPILVRKEPEGGL